MQRLRILAGMIRGPAASTFARANESPERRGKLHFTRRENPTHRFSLALAATHSRHISPFPNIRSRIPHSLTRIDLFIRIGYDYLLQTSALKLNGSLFLWCDRRLRRADDARGRSRERDIAVRCARARARRQTRGLNLRNLCFFFLRSATSRSRAFFRFSLD